MAKKRVKEAVGRRNRILAGETEDEYEHNVTVDKRYKRKIMLLESATDKDIREVLMEFGSYNLSYKAIAGLLNMQTSKFTAMMDKGEKDFNEDIVSEERLMYVAYQYGLKSLESNTVVNMSAKTPDKLLAILNPDVYSDKITDKYDMPKIVINFGKKDKVEDVEVTIEEDDDIEE